MSNVLLPLLSSQENDKSFLTSALKEVSTIVLLLVIDKQDLGKDFGFAANQIYSGNKLLEELKKLLDMKGFEVVDVMEWGDTLTKIVQASKMHKVDRIVLKKMDNHYFKKLVKDLEKQVKAKIEVF
ncbi:MAG: hypothetical protein ABH821_04095 [archaeon]